MRNERRKDNQRALIVKKIADKHRVSFSYIYKILNGERENEKIFADYMELKEQINNVFDNAFLEAVKKAASL